MTCRFTIRTLLLAIALASCVFACLFVPGGPYVHLPLTLMGILALTSLQSAARLCLARHARAQLRRYRRQLIVSTVLLALAAGVYLPFFGIAVQKMKSSQFAASQMGVLLSVDDPIPIRDAARTLHQRLVNLPPEDRRIDGESDILPLEIASLHPQYVTVYDEAVGVMMCCTPTDWFGLLIYPEGCEEVGGDRKLADGIWYWETP